MKSSEHTKARSGESGQVAVVVPAAGEGSRLGGHRKQFRRLGGQPLLVQTLRVFQAHPGVNHLTVAAPEDALEALEAELRSVGLSKLHGVFAGGDTRQASVQAALHSVPSSVRFVLIHDAVRPFLEAVRLSTAPRPSPFPWSIRSAEP